MKNIILKLTFLALIAFSGSNLLVAIGYNFNYMKCILYPVVILGTIAVIYFNRALFNEKTHIEVFGLLLFVLIAVCYIVAGRGVYSVNFYSVCLFPLLYSTLLKYSEKSQTVFVFLKRTCFVFFIINSTIAILERLFLKNLLPNIGDDVVLDFSQEEGFRSLGLMGHPLNGAFFTATMTLFVLFSYLKTRQKLILFFMGITSLFCYNSRAAILGVGMGTVAYFLRNLLFDKTLKSRLYLIIGGIIFICIIKYLLESGLGDRLVDFGTDKSSEVRSDNLMVLYFLSIKDLLFGLNNNEVYYATLKYGGTTSIIENPWINYILRYGLVFLCVLVIFYGYYFYNQIKDGKKYGYLIIFFVWLIVQSSNNGFSAACDTSIVLLMTLLFVFKHINRHEKLN